MDPSGNNFGYSTYIPQGGFLKLKSICSISCCDFFGVFSQYLAPAYHHDRCERSVQMKLYSLHKRELVGIILGFFVALSLVILIGLVGPPITWTHEISASSLKNVTDFSTGPFALPSPPLSAYHQQVWLIAEIVTRARDGESFEKTFQMSLDLFGLDSNSKGGLVKLYEVPTEKERHLSCSPKNQANVKNNEIDNNIANGAACEPITLLHLGFIDFHKYYILIKFYGLESINERYHIQDVRFYFKSYNPSFTQLELSFRFIYTCSSFVITCWFVYSLRKYVTADWSIEQRWMSILLPLLFLYNNPAFPLMFLMNSVIPGMIDAVFQVSFLSGLLIFWLSIYHGLRQVERKFLTFYMPKILLVGSLWVSAILLASWQKLNTTRDPTYNYELDTVKFNNLKTFFTLCGILYVLDLVYLMFKAYSELRSMPYFDLRLKFLTGLMLIVMKITIGLTYMRFGMDILEDHFVADLSTKYSSSAEFMSFYGLLNFSVYTMALVYSPTSSVTLSSNSTQITKDNPSFSMINDSDEDVIYGSEEEQSKTPLNHHRSTRTTNSLIHHDDESD